MKLTLVVALMIVAGAVAQVDSVPPPPPPRGEDSQAPPPPPPRPEVEGPPSPPHPEDEDPPSPPHPEDEDRPHPPRPMMPRPPLPPIAPCTAVALNVTLEKVGGPLYAQNNGTCNLNWKTDFCTPPAGAAINPAMAAMLKAYAAFFAPSCMYHDFGYANAAVHGLRRSVVDEAFKRNLEIQCESWKSVPVIGTATLRERDAEALASPRKPPAKPPVKPPVKPKSPKAPEKPERSPAKAPLKPPAKAPGKPPAKPPKASGPPPKASAHAPNALPKPHPSKADREGCHAAAHQFAALVRSQRWAKWTGSNATATE